MKLGDTKEILNTVPAILFHYYDDVPCYKLIGLEVTEAKRSKTVDLAIA